MKAGSGKGKGAAFEREVSRRLSLWLSEGKRDDLLWRSAMSGGLATLQYRKDKINLTQSGDLSAIGEGAYEFCEKTFVECKHYQDLQIGRSIVNKTGGLITFWKIVVREARKYDKRPLLIAKQNRYPTIVVTDTRHPRLWLNPIVTVDHWEVPAFVYNFDNVTSVRRPLRRGN